jgi:UDP-N-acetylglucosamine--N-acetylmuramyl-(pentapeptide) pyrophosphoryl-undecaprenol N-acetylglucosamine transferase
MEEELVMREGIHFQSIPAAGVHGVGLRALPRNLYQLARGTLASRRILRKFKPDVLFFTGGYVAGPMALAGRNVPALLYVPDIEPGLALKSLARSADRIGLTAEESRKYFRGDKRTFVSGYPVRADLGNWTRAQGRASFGLSGDLPILLVVGGSQGARSINTAIMENLASLLEIAQVIHISGQLDWPVVESMAKTIHGRLAGRYQAMPYLHEMGAALAAADLVVSRAGASVLGEFPAFGVPGVLVPYPHAWRYQKVNADYLAERGAAVILQDEILNDRLLPAVHDLLLNPAKRDAMRTAMQSLARPQAAALIAGQLIDIAGGSKK